MATPSTLLMGENRIRRVKDTLARVGVTASGIFVLITLLLIFFYLLYVIVPVFSSVSVKPIDKFSLSLPGKTALLGVDESNTIAYRFTTDGQVDFIRLAPSADAGKIIKQQRVVNNPTDFALSLPREGMVAYASEGGKVSVVTADFLATFSDGHKQLAPAVSYPFGTRALQLTPNGENISQLAISGRAESALIVGKTTNNKVYGLRLWLTDTLNRQAGTGWQHSRFQIKNVPSHIDDLKLTPDGKTLYLLSGSDIYVFGLSDSGSHLRDIVNVSSEHSMPLRIDLLSGANSLLITHSDNRVSQWFEAVKEGERRLINARNFHFSESPLTDLVPEYDRKGFFALQENGLLSAYYTVERKVIYQDKVLPEGTDEIAISPKANMLLAVKNNVWTRYLVNNPHPDIGLSSLWQKVWYEGYPEPSYVWQSTSGSDEFEPKLSLVPIVFGTLKVAMYSMLFAIPVALSGAIYTAYFMSTKMRRLIKPTVELMEAFPTVILGFLAGIWLAPIVAQYLPAFIMAIILFPFTIIFVGWGWSRLPGPLRSKVPNGFHIALLIPIIALLGYACFSFSPLLERWLFSGSLPDYLTNNLGIVYDQRNALIVGIAMGFAVIPTIFTIAEDAIFSVPSHLTKGSLALGATQWQTLTRVVLLTASPGIFSAVMMGLGRAVGETMIVLMATGNTPIMDWNLLQGLRTIAATIAIEMPESEVGSSHYRVLFLAAFVLFVFTFVFNTIAEIVRQRLREKYSSL